MTAWSVKAISFDLWDTIVYDDSDEPKRRALGLLSKRNQRRQDLWEALNRFEPIPQETVVRAYDVAEAAFNTAWREQHVTWSVATRLTVVLEEVGRQLSEEDFAEVVRAHEEMEIDPYPDLIPGCAEALDALAERYSLAIVSDAVVSPGRCLRRLLEIHGVARYFSGYAFSDEVGRSKPHRAMFESAAAQVGVDVREMIHVGDRNHNDVKGPQALGMKAVFFTASRDTDKATTTADAICESYADLPEVIEVLGARP